MFNLATRELFRFEALRRVKGRRHYLTLGASGRCDIVLRDSFVSAVHAAVVWHEDAIRIIDVMSRNGVLQVVHRRTQKIHHAEFVLGQRFVLGRTTLVCVTGAGHAPLAAFDVAELAGLSFDILADRPAAHRLPRRIIDELRQWASGRHRAT